MSGWTTRRQNTQTRYTREFKKQYTKAPEKIRSAFKMRRDLLASDFKNPVLNNHKLKGKFRGYKSINITGDWRAIYLKQSRVMMFVMMGTHSQLYK